MAIPEYNSPPFERLAKMFNEDILPVIYEMGSLGASGDLAPLAHLTLPLIGLGEVVYQENKFSGEAINQKLQWHSIHLEAKEGLALLNGTQFMSAYGVWCTLHAHRLLKLANIIGALSLDAFDGRIEPFLPQVHAIRPHPGQVEDSKRHRIESCREVSSSSKQKNMFRIPIHSVASLRFMEHSSDAIDYVTNVFIVEVNSVTDNPNVFPEEDTIISAGNFHGQPLALALDFLVDCISRIGKYFGEENVPADLWSAGPTQLPCSQSRY